MRIIFSANDAGLTSFGNGGVIKSIDDGAVSMVNVMLDHPGTEDMLTRLADRTWISLSWQADFTGSPVSSPEDVPDLTDGSGRFRSDLSENADRAQLEAEARAQVERCIRIYGRAPVSAEFSGSGIFYDTLSAVCDEYGICHDYEKAGIKIYSNPEQPGLSFDDYPKYDPMAELNSLPVNEGCTYIFPLYPCYLDVEILRDKLHDGNSIRSVQRIQDVVFLCSEELKNWIESNHAEIVNFSDVIFGKRDYQNYQSAKKRGIL